MTENEAIKILEEHTQYFIPANDADALYTVLDIIQQYRKIGTVEECREAAEKLKRAEGALNVILSGNYNDECSFCVHNDNPIANCQCICGDGSWCIHNAKWNGKTSEGENLEGTE